MILAEPVSPYIDSLRPSPDPVLAEMEAHARRDGIPIVVPPTGQLLRVLALACGATAALEVGTAIGVSTLYIARGLAAGGRIVSFEIDSERHAAARDYLQRAGVGDRADLRLQDAREGLSSLAGPFDFAFLDGVKLQYGDYFDLVEPLLAPGAVLVVDNVLMGGDVAAGGDSERLRFARAFNERLISYADLVSTLTPIGDGVLIAVRR